MARPTLFVLLVLSITAVSSAAKYHRELPRSAMGLKREKLSHFKLYWHDILTGSHPTSVRIVNPPANVSMTGFGLMNMIDNPLTMGPDLKSKMVGKAQGFYASAGQKELGLLMAMNFAFTDGKYNGSTITVLGRNTIFSKVREMPVVGGTGLLRFARGYVQATTNTVDFKTGNACVEYNVYVLHY